MTDILNPFDVAKNINSKTGNISFGDKAKKVPMFVVNKTFSNTIDSLMYANEVNKFSIDDNQMSYDFYYYALPKKKRFGKYNKKPKADEVYDSEFVDAIMEVYKYSTEKALQCTDILSDHRDDIIKLVFKGGMENKNGVKRR